jgi:TonB family protein
VLDKAALEALRTWRYEPATKAGVKVKVHFPIRLTFREGS